MRRPLARPAPLLAAVFFFSGLASLIYQVAWQRLLTIPYGVGAVSIALIVSVYMLGLGLGSLLGGRLSERISRPYVLYAAVEGVLGVVGLISFRIILSLGQLTAASDPVVSFACLFAFLCIPTLLMGITLPLLTTIFTGATGDFVYSISRLYFINTLGASAGAVLTSYILVSLLGWNGCIYLAACINFVLAAAILSARRVEPQAAASEPLTADSLGRAAYLLVFVTGFIAIGYEILWYRVIGVLVKDSPYAFSTVLAVYLLGIAFGSRAIHRYMARNPEANRRDLFYILQFLIGLSVLLTFAGYYHLSRHAPIGDLTRLAFSSDLHPSLDLLSQRPGLSLFQHAFLLLDVFLWPLAFLFVPTLFMGASFPLISALALSRRGGEGRAVGTTYCFGVFGNVLGALLTGFVLLPLAGTERTVLAFALLGLMFGLAPRTVGRRSVPGAARFACVSVLVIAAVASCPRPGELYAAMHTPPFASGTARFVEGFDSVVFTWQNGEQMRNFINGQGHGYRPGPLFYAEAIEGLTFTPSPRKVLIIGFGAGSITEAALLPSEVQQVTLVELNASLIENLRKFPVTNRILGDRRVTLVIDDGRRLLERSGERFDAILMDPLRTTTAYSNNLHSRQFFSLSARHLTPGGVLMVGGVSDSAVIPRTLLEEFPYVRAYPSFSLASKASMRQNHDRLERMLGSFDPEMQAAIWSLAQDAVDGATLVAATSDYPSNQDWRPVSEYYLGLQFRRLLSKIVRPHSPP